MSKSCFRSLCSGVVVLVVATVSFAQPATPPVGPVTADGKSLAVTVQPAAFGDRKLSEAVKLDIKSPEIRDVALSVKTPGDYAPHFEDWSPWPGGNKESGPLAAGISPKQDEDHTMILGSLFRAILPETLVLKSADGTKFERDKDFKFNEDFGQIAGIGGHLGKPGAAMLKASYQYATQRLDLVQIDAAGKVSLKPGKSVVVCPQLPAADEGSIAIAGVYVAPWKHDGKFAIAQEDIYPITPAKPVEPINAAALQGARDKLAQGRELRIAFVGDSITLGAEAGEWWNGMFTQGNTTYATRVVLGLRAMYPTATITPIHAAKGATTTKAAAGLLDNALGNGKADVVVIAFGMNDAAGPVGKSPTNPPEEYKKDITALIHHARDLGAEVILVVPMQPNPWLKNKVAERILDYRKVLLDLSKEENCGVADVNTAWLRQADAGVPPFSQLHNWNNHPGPAGHAVYAKTILRFFGDEKPAAAAPAAKPSAALATDGAVAITAEPQSAAPATQPSAAAHDFPPVVQPTEIPGKWKFDAPPLPDLKAILAAAKPNPLIYGLYTWPSEYFTNREAIREVGWKSFRSGGPFDDKAMTAYVQDDVEVLHTMGTKLGKEEGAEAKLLHDYPEQIDKFLNRYGPGGSFFTDNPALPVRPVKYVEICNEPNFQYVIPPDGRKPAELEAAREALYAKILPAAYAVKEKHKDVTIVGFGAGGAAAADVRFIKNVHADNPQVVKSYDILSTHPYVQPAAPDMYSIRSWGQYSTASCLAEIRKTLADNGRPDATIWYTEVGWPISKADGGKFDDKPNEIFVTPLLQAAYVVRLYALAQRLGVERVHIMFNTDSDHFNAGFFMTDSVWRPSAKAAATMIKLMPAPKLLNAITDGTDGTFVYEFAADARDGAKPQNVIMAWNVAGPKTIDLPVPADEVTVTDMLGHDQPMTAKNKTLSLPIGPCPVYVRVKSQLYGGTDIPVCAEARYASIRTPLHR